jgi:hypothetical protein
MGKVLGVVANNPGYELGSAATGVLLIVVGASDSCCSIRNARLSVCDNLPPLETVFGSPARFPKCRIKTTAAPG